MKVSAVVQHDHSCIRKRFLSCWVENDLEEARLMGKRPGTRHCSNVGKRLGLNEGSVNGMEGMHRLGTSPKGHI